MSFFKDVDNDDSNLDLSALKHKRQNRPRKSFSTTKSIAELSRLSDEQGWQDRSHRKPGPKRKEVRSVLTMNGPARVINCFREYAEKEDISQWQALEQIMLNASISVPQKQK